MTKSGSCAMHTSGCTCRPTTSSTTTIASTMASSIARLHRVHPLLSSVSHFASPSCSSGLLYLPSHRHAMMSSHDHAPRPTSSSSKPLGETPPVVVPSLQSPAPSAKAPTAKTLSPHAASPQVAARPPPAPKAERPRPTIKATKAAITLVRLLVY